MAETVATSQVLEILSSKPAPLAVGSSRTGARTGLSPPALASKSGAFIHSATEGTNPEMLWQ